MILENSVTVFSQQYFAVVVCVIYLAGFVSRSHLSLRRVARQSGQMVCMFSCVISVQIILKN
jgi:hypothetical protein